MRYFLYVLATGYQSRKILKSSFCLALVLFLSLEMVHADFVGATNNKCSDYKFFDDRKSWEDSNIACKRENGTLVVMETEDEWKVINSVIQRIPTPTEWYIGLQSKKKSQNKNSFTWINGKNLTFDKWAQREPSGNGLYVKIIKKHGGQGTFDDVDGRMPYICEYHLDSMPCTKPSESTPLPTVTTTTTATTTTTTTATTTATTTKKTTVSSTTRRKVLPHTTPKSASSSTNYLATTKAVRKPTATTTNQPYTKITVFKTPVSRHLSATKTTETPHITNKDVLEKTKDRQKPESEQKDDMTAIYIVVSLAIILVALVGFLAYFYWKRKRKDKRRSTEDNPNQPTSTQPATATNISEITKSNSFVAFKMVQNKLSDNSPSEAGPVYDSISTDKNQASERRTQLTENNEGSQGYANVSVKKKRFSLKRNKGSVSESKGIKMNEVNPSTSNEENKNEDAIYAEVDKTKKTKVAQDVTYADLAFNNSAESNVHKPAPYQPVEYAVIIGKKQATVNIILIIVIIINSISIIIIIIPEPS